MSFSFDDTDDDSDNTVYHDLPEIEQKAKSQTTKEVETKQRIKRALKPRPEFMFDPNIFYADLVYKQSPKYDDGEIKAAIQKGDYNDLIALCEDLNYCVGSQSIAERLVFRAEYPSVTCQKFINRHPEMSLASLFFYPLINPMIIDRVFKDVKKLVRGRYDIEKCREYEKQRMVLSMILSKWDRLPSLLQHQMGLARLKLMRKEDKVDFIRYIPPWVVNPSQLQFSNLDWD